MSVLVALYLAALPMPLETLSSKTCEVVKITDGDTIRVSCQGKIDRIRFCGIDSPEAAKRGKSAQPFSKEAKNLVKQLLSGGKVEITPLGRDRYGRTIGELFVGKTFINAEVVKAGYAYEYKAYSKTCPHKIEISNAEAIAQRNKVGIWDGGNYQFPWDFRKQK